MNVIKELQDTSGNVVYPDISAVYDSNGVIYSDRVLQNLDKLQFIFRTEIMNDSIEFADGSNIDYGDIILEIDPIVGAWSVTGNLLTSRFGLAGCGSQDSVLSFGGDNGTILPNTEKFNGSTWSNTGNLLTGRPYLAGCGSQDSGLSFGGDNGTTLPNTEKFNGSTWSNTGNLLTGRQYLAGCGLQDSGLSFGGDNNIDLNNTEKFNGSTWSNTGNLLKARNRFSGCGLQDSGLSFGGYSNANLFPNTEKFNGSTWINTGDLLTGRRYLSGCGLQDSGLSFGGYTSTYLPNTEKFNGYSWSNTGNLLLARSELAGCGSQDSSLSFGGSASYNTPLPNTEKFNTSLYGRTSIANTNNKLTLTHYDENDIIIPSFRLNVLSTKPIKLSPFPVYHHTGRNAIRTEDGTITAANNSELNRYALIYVTNINDEHIIVPTYPLNNSNDVMIIDNSKNGATKAISLTYDKLNTPNLKMIAVGGVSIVNFNSKKFAYTVNVRTGKPTTVTGLAMNPSTAVTTSVSGNVTTLTHVINGSTATYTVTVNTGNY